MGRKQAHKQAHKQDPECVIDDAEWARWVEVLNAVGTRIVAMAPDAPMWQSERWRSKFADGRMTPEGEALMRQNLANSLGRLQGLREHGAESAMYAELEQYIAASGAYDRAIPSMLWTLSDFYSQEPEKKRQRKPATPDPELH